MCVPATWPHRMAWCRRCRTGGTPKRLAVFPPVENRWGKQRARACSPSR